jgi:AcrR family transcriptional regulator
LGSSEQKPSAAETPLRSDAQRNKDEILAAAARAFTKDARASLEGIAKAAGVGIGTLYRHFPTREALVEAAWRNEVEKLCQLAPGLLAKHRPDLALARFLDRLIDDLLTKHGMLEAMRAVVAAGPTHLNPSLAMFAAAVAPIIEAGKSEGLLRDDVTVDDFLSIKAAVTLARPESARRLATLLVDGLRHGARVPKARGEVSSGRKAARRTRRWLANAQAASVSAQSECASFASMLHATCREGRPARCSSSESCASNVFAQSARTAARFATRTRSRAAASSRSVIQASTWCDKAA